MHFGDQRHLGLCLGYVPALALGSCRVSDQGTTLRAFDLHNARATILNPFNNATYHSAIGIAPRAVTDTNAEQVWLHLYGPDQKKMSKKMTSIDSKLKRGDHVRLNKTRRQFAKGYTGHWSREIFLVTDILNTVPVTYRIMDVSGEDVSGTFYGPELQKITPPDYFDVEAVLDTRRKHGRAKYLVSFNSWQTDLITPVA